MKNFIFVVNKEKIYAYVVSVCTIVILFFMSTFINRNFGDTEETAVNIEENTIVNEIDNNIIN